MKIIDAICVTSEFQERRQIRFDEASGLIEAIGDLGHSMDEVDFYYDDSTLLFAGMGDVHIHAREDVSQKNVHKEDFHTAQAAMINGGVTHAGDMPNNPIPPVDEASYEAKLRLAEKVHGDIWIYAGIGPATRPLSYPVPYKVYMGPSVGELFFKDLETLDETLSHYRGEVVSFHCEDPEILEENKSRPHHHERRPVLAESIATRDALMLIQKYQLKGKLCHFSSGEGLKLVREARQKGVQVALEVTPQHLYFNIDELREEQYKDYQMNPPLRSEEDRKMMWDAFVNGEIQFLATDHAPHTEEEKQKGTSGLTGLDTFAPFVSWLIHEGVDPKLIAKQVSENPGDFYNQFLPSWKKISQVYGTFGKGVGYLLPGFRANFTLINLAYPVTITKEGLRTKVQHSPFLGVTFPGSVEAVFIGGQKV